ncbi:DUF418 domain-containing protein [Bacillus sp. HMF5848]|uniref:DUF418 domain-containing protein n=1 Tax=Bacillus sp. HMF5848 TaxID=2495421 RepID=UPI000F7B5A01|nr:DUF418 domain-containing protein [Bacillus sp. HMF5848]RSK25867.1 DUF418 domain-containing protein [Bacillus sp. HMF5848]
MKSSPVLGKERIVTIDIIRGFALFGIFLVNMPSFHSPLFLDSLHGMETEYAGLDYWVDLFFTLFVDSKFFTIFSFLFGLGFYIFMSRAEEKGLRMNRLYIRRILGLLLLGLLHLILLWYGDILHSYAITGLLLLLFYKRKVKTMVVWAITLLVLFHLLLSSMLLLPNEVLVDMQESSAVAYEAQKTEYINVYETAGYAEWVAYRLQTEVPTVLMNLLIVMLPILAMFLFGLAAGKIGIFKDVTAHLSLIRKIRNVAFIVSIPIVVLLALYKLEILDAGLKTTAIIQTITYLSGVTMSLVYIFTLTLLLRKESWQKRLRPLGYVGQMALTNYLSQTIISIAIFVGLGFFGDVSLTVGTIICLLIFGLQVIFSRYWLSAFQFGPFEWLWRCFTYWKLQPLKKKQVAR